MSYTGWLLPEADRVNLLAIFPAAYHDVIAHHVTLKMGITDLPVAVAGTVVGMVDDGMGCQTLVIEIEGSTTRWDGRTYHITWSIDRETHNRKPMHSMEILQNLGWQPVEPIAITLMPAVFPD